MAINEKQKAWSITKAELDLRFDLIESKITSSEFDRRYRELLKQGKIVRNGRVAK